MDAGRPMLGNLQSPSKVFLDPGLETLIAAVSPHECDRGEQDVEEAEQEHAARLVMDVGRVDPGLQEIALGSDQPLPLPARDLLATVIAARTASLSGLDRLAVDDRRSWLRLSAPGEAAARTHDLGD